MLIKLDKFGDILVSRPAGKEAYLAFQPTLRNIKDEEIIEIDFGKVEVLTPSWVDEFLTPIINSFGNRVNLVNTENPSVRESLKILGLGNK